MRNVTQSRYQGFLFCVVAKRSQSKTTLLIDVLQNPKVFQKQIKTIAD